MSDPTVVVSFKDTPHSEKVRQDVEARCAHLALEFPETTRFEVTLTADGLGFSAHGHVTGRDTEVAGHAAGEHLGEAADRMLAKLERALRKVHDKKIFNSRREARKAGNKRHGA